MFAGSKVEVVLDSTPFYAESGGQAGDQGRLFSIPAEASTSDADTPIGRDVTLRVHDCQKGGGGNLFVHSATVESGEARVGQRVRILNFQFCLDFFGKLLFILNNVSWHRTRTWTGWARFQHAGGFQSRASSHLGASKA